LPDEGADQGDASATILFEDRKALSLDSFRGKVVALELGGVGCPLTETFYKALLDLREEYPKGVEFIRVDYNQSVKQTAGYYKKHPPSFHVLGDPSGAIGKSLPSQAYPTMYLFGKWGKMRYMGGFEPASFRSMLNRLLAEEGMSEKNFFLDRKMGKGDILPVFKLPDLSGAERELADLRRDARAFVLVFAGTGCPISSQAVKKLGSLAGKAREAGLSVVIVNIGEERDAAAKIYLPMKLPFPVLIDREESLVKAFGIDTVPTVFVADKDGRIVLRSLWNYEAVKQEIDILLGKMKPEDRKKIEQQGTG
jgi:peroxiredoxin